MTFRITPTTELQAVNTLLSIIGEAPVSQITSSTGVDVSIALQILDETNVEVQSRGWHFNTDTEYSLALDSGNKIPVSSNVVQVDASKYYKLEYDITLRNGFLYDLENKTDIFTAALVVDQIAVQQFEHIPEYARKLIICKAGRKFQARMIGSSELAGFTKEDENEAIVNAERSDAANGDYNVLSGNSSTYNIINRTNRRSY
jgi:hypothetical protein|tara:strand:- start:2330 stop:2935 length:606 start_codon:yes stop_codon:yes gene_type:complete